MLFLRCLKHRCHPDKQFELLFLKLVYQGFVDPYLLGRITGAPLTMVRPKREGKPVQGDSHSFCPQEAEQGNHRKIQQKPLASAKSELNALGK